MSNHFFSENGHIAYKTKANDTCNNMQSIILSLYAPSIPGWGQNVKTFFSESSKVAYQIKANDMYDNMQANDLPLHTPSTPGWGLKFNIFFF